MKALGKSCRLGPCIGTMNCGRMKNKIEDEDEDEDENDGSWKAFEGRPILPLGVILIISLV